MRLTMTGVVLALSGGAAALAAVTTSAPGSSQAGLIQYRVMRMDAGMPNFEAMLNQLGREGWDLVLVEMDDGQYIFKRRG